MQLLLTLFVLLLLNPRVYQWFLLFFLIINAVRLSITLNSELRVVLLELLRLRFLMSLLLHLVLLFTIFTNLFLLVDLPAHIDCVLDVELVISNALWNNIPNFVNFAHLN